MPTSKKKRLQANDANLCRFKGWEVGSLLEVGGESYRITAIGEEAILVRRIGQGEHAEKRWVNTLLDNEVSAKPVEFRLRSERRNAR